MSWLPKRLLRWKEPMAFVREKEALEMARWRWWYRPAAAVLLALTWWAGALGKMMDRSGDFDALVPSPDRALVLVVGALVFVWGFPALFRFLPASITVYEDRIARSRGNANWQLKFSQVATFSWEARADYQVLTLVPRRGTREVRLGVPLDIPRDTIQMLLIRHDAMPLPGARSPVVGSAFAKHGAGV